RAARVRVVPAKARDAKNGDEIVVAPRVFELARTTDEGVTNLARAPLGVAAREDGQLARGPRVASIPRALTGARASGAHALVARRTITSVHVGRGARVLGQERRLVARAPISARTELLDRRRGPRREPVGRSRVAEDALVALAGEASIERLVGPGDRRLHARPPIAAALDASCCARVEVALAARRRELARRVQPRPVGAAPLAA